MAVGTALAIFLRDLKRILRNPVATLVVLGICIVPCLYAWINVLANWDPYENTSDMPIAVVNQDQAVTLDSVGTICVGDLMVDALKDNDKIGWIFTDEDEALSRVRSGDYYAAIIIPQDFSARLTGILSGRTDKAQLRYYVNEKVNPIAPKVADTGASTLETTLDSQFIAKVGEVVAEKLGAAADKAIGDSLGFIDREAGTLDNVYVTLVDVGSELGDLTQKIKDAQSALSDAVDRMSPLQGIGARTSEKLDGLLGQLSETRTNANALVGDINNALGTGANSVNVLSSRATTDLSAISGDISAAISQVNAAIRSLENDLTDDQAMVASLTNARELMASITPTGADTASMKVEIDKEITRELDIMVQISAEQQAKIDELRGIAQQLQDAADAVNKLSQSVGNRIGTATDALNNARTGDIARTLAEVNSALDSFATIGNQLSSATKTVDPIITQTVTLARQFADSLAGTDAALAGTRGSLEELSGFVASLKDELAAIRASQTWSVAQNLLETNPQGVHDFLEAPVEINNIRLFPVENYASGVAPFFTSLALWVGGIALVAIFKLEVDEDGVGRVKPWQAYFGRWILFVLVGMLQAIICCTGDLIIGIQCAHPWAFFLSAIVASFAFVNIIYALSVAFKHLGKALAFTLVILQVPGSAGMYPIEMMPPFFQAIGPWLPFTYSNNALREAVAGFYGSNLAYNLGMLLLFVVPALLIGVTARGHLVNVNALFDRRLRETDHLMVSEPTAIEGNHYRLATIVKAYHNPVEYRAELDERSAAFERIYPTLARRGILALLLLPLGAFLLMLLLDAQLPTIACFVIALVAIYSFLVVIEFYHDRIQRKRSLTELSSSELEEVLYDALRDELLPQASVDAILARRAAKERTGVLGRILHSQDVDGDGAGDAGEPSAEDAGEPSDEGRKDPEGTVPSDPADDGFTVPPYEAPKGGDAR